NTPNAPRARCRAPPRTAPNHRRARAGAPPGSRAAPWQGRFRERSRAARRLPRCRVATAARARSRAAPAERRFPAACRDCPTQGPASLGERVFLQADELRDAALGEREKRVELLARERIALGGALHLDESALAGHHHVHVAAAGGVLGIVEVEERHALMHTD